jgi:hypothetical protein
MRVLSIIMALIIVLVMISPVMALGVKQEVNAVSIGDGTIQDIDNTMNVVDKSQEINAAQIGGNHNTQTITSTNNEYNGVGGSNSVSVVLNIPKGEAGYRGFDIGTITTQIISMYEGDPLVVMNDENSPKLVVSQPGDKFRYTIKSSIPVLAYIVSGKDVDRVLYDSDVTPVYDIISKKYDYGNLDVAYKSKYRSPQQQFEVTVEEPGRYAVVIDSRVSRNIDGRFTKITGSTFDVAYTIEKMANDAPKQLDDNKIGAISMYTIFEDGKADTQNETILRKPTI